MRKPLIAFLLSAVLGLSACAHAPVRKVGDRLAPTPQAVATDSDGALNVFILRDSRLAEALVTGFQAEYPEILVKVQMYFPPPGDAQFDPIAAARADVDAGKIDVFSGMAFAPADGSGVPLDPLIAKSAFDLAPFGEVPEQLRVRGRLFEMPLLADPYVIAYNRDMFEAAGLPLPAPDWTWDDLRAYAAKLTHGAGKEKVWGLTTGGGMLPGLAVDWFEWRAPGAWQSDESVLREGLQFLTALVAEGVTPPLAESSPNAPRSLYFGWGQSALEYNTYGNLLYQTQGTNISWGVVPAPMSGLSGGFYETLAISAKSVRQEAAWKFVAFACGLKGARILAARGQASFYRSPEVAQVWTEAVPPPPAGSHVLVDLPISLAGHRRSLTNAESLAMNLIYESLSAPHPWEEALANYLQARSELK